MTDDADYLGAVRAIAHPSRYKIIGWLLDPTAHFPPQKDGDLVEDGVCVAFITDKLGLSQPTVTSHMRVLSDHGLVTSKKVKNWVFYKAHVSQILKVKTLFLDGIKPD